MQSRQRRDGVLLVLKTGAGVVAVEIVEGALLRKTACRPGRPESREAMKKIRRDPLIYLQSGQARQRRHEEWLQDNEYADAPVLPWDGGACSSRSPQMGLKIRAVVGNPQ